MAAEDNDTEILEKQFFWAKDRQTKSNELKKSFLEVLYVLRY